MRSIELDGVKNIGYITVREFYPWDTDSFVDAFNYIEASNQDIVPVVVNSYGGYVDALTVLVDEIQMSKKPVATFVTGKAMSCGAVLAASGTKGFRFMSPNSRYMIHSAASVTWGKSQEMLADAMECQRLTDWSLDIFDKAANKESGFFANEVAKRNNADWFLTAQEALDYGLIDHIENPSIMKKLGIPSLLEVCEKRKKEYDIE